MLRRRPLLVDLLVTLATLRGSRVEREGLLVDRWNGGVLALRALCDGSEDGHLPFAVRPRGGGNLLIAAGCIGLGARRAGFSGGAFALGSLLLVRLDQSFEHGVRVGLRGLSQPDALLFV